MIALIFFSFLAGVVTVLSPCILPILPILLAAQVGQGYYRPYGIIVGLISSFTFFTLALTALVHATGVSPDFLRYGAIGITIFFGLTLLFPWLGDRFTALTSVFSNLGTAIQERATLVGTGFLSGFILGGALGLIWTPCAGPILATITALVATSAVNINAIMITLVYSFGAALPMFLIMYGGNRIINSTQFLAGYTELIRKVFGALMILGALAIAFHFDVVLQQFAVRYFPMITIEDNQTVQKELEKLKMNNHKKTISLIDGEQESAPALIGITDWINTPPLSLQQLKGKVVLIDFWTYSCINCVRTLPYIKQWYEAYKDKGLVIIGVHTPEFEFEKNSNNVKAAVKRFEIKYPVALDNNYQTWQNYNNSYWPAHYLIDQEGVMRYKHFGEGNYTETENAIRSLLGLQPEAERAESFEGKPITPETYLGYKRAQQYHADLNIKKDQTASYDYAEQLDNNMVGLKGSWLIGPESIQAMAESTLDLNFIANRVYLVMSSPATALVPVLLDGNPVSSNYRTKDMNAQGQLIIHEPRMYDIIDLKGNYSRHILTLKIPKGVSAFVFTFGAQAQ